MERFQGGIAALPDRRCPFDCSITRTRRAPGASRAGEGVAHGRRPASGIGERARRRAQAYTPRPAHATFWGQQQTLSTLPERAAERTADVLSQIINSQRVSTRHTLDTARILHAIARAAGGWRRGRSQAAQVERLDADGAGAALGGSTAAGAFSGSRSLALCSTAICYQQC